MIIPGENFPGVGWGEGGHQGEVCLAEIYRNIYAKNSQVYIHSHWSSSEKSSCSKPIASVFIPPPIIILSFGVEISFNKTGHGSALIGYIEM